MLVPTVPSFTLHSGDRLITRRPHMKPAACDALAAHVRRGSNNRKGSRRGSHHKTFRVFCVPACVPAPFAVQPLLP